MAGNIILIMLDYFETFTLLDNHEMEDEGGFINEFSNDRTISLWLIMRCWW